MLIHAIAVLIAGFIWGLLFMLAGWSFGVSVPFLGAWVSGFAFVVLMRAIRA